MEFRTISKLISRLDFTFSDYVHKRTTRKLLSFETITFDIIDYRDQINQKYHDFCCELNKDFLNKVIIQDSNALFSIPALGTNEFGFYKKRKKKRLNFVNQTDLISKLVHPKKLEVWGKRKNEGKNVLRSNLSEFHIE